MDKHARLRLARKTKFRTAKQAAEALGVPYGTYSGHESGSRGFDEDDAKRYAKFFRVAAAWLLLEDGEGPGEDREVVYRDIPAIQTIDEFEAGAEALIRGEAPPPPPRVERTPYIAEPNAESEGAAVVRWTPPVRDVEELGIGIASIDDDDSAFELNGQVVDRVVRPPGLMNRPGVFALRVANHSMWPKYRDGERVYVDSKKPAIEDFVVVELKPTEDGRPGKAYVKMLVSMDARKVVVEQFNPPGRLEFSRDEILRILRVIPNDELYG
ncbi:helix-turn-helix domain-containing protein [Boseaceae bacterium BT-24-1]|nr:helix-turn-helix domain-containing protein [Boseaceae bacterium BT-24-1]